MKVLVFLLSFLGVCYCNAGNDESPDLDDFYFVKYGSLYYPIPKEFVLVADGTRSGLKYTRTLRQVYRRYNEDYELTYEVASIQFLDDLLDIKEVIEIGTIFREESRCDANIVFLRNSMVLSGNKEAFINSLLIQTNSEAFVIDGLSLKLHESIVQIFSKLNCE